MTKIAFMGAGSTVFAKNVLGDSMLAPALQDAEIALYDIDAQRLKESKQMLDILNKNVNKNRANITSHHGVRSRKTALRGADFVLNAIQVGGYEPSTVIDFEIPKRYGLRQTIGDTLGVGGIFRALRTIPVMLDFARDMEAVCPDAWLLNYTNPMSMITGAMLKGTDVKTIGLCHSVQVCANSILNGVGLRDEVKDEQWKIAGINHMAWLLEIADENGKDLYPEIKKRARKLMRQWRKADSREAKNPDMVRIEMMLKLGYYITESSEHNAEYCPWFIKSAYPELVEEYRIPLDEYPRRCVNQQRGWRNQSRDLIKNRKLTHKRTHEYASYIMESMVTDTPYSIGGNVMNTGLIPNLPHDAVVEVPCLVDGNGVQGTYVGDLPQQCAAMNRTNINVHLLTIEAALTKKKEHIYQAAMLDPHTASELSLDDIVKMCNELIREHGDMLPKYQ